MNQKGPHVPTLTLNRFIHQEQRKFPGSSGELSDLLSGLVLGVKIVASLVQTAGFKGLQGYSGNVNVQGEATKILDDESDRTFIDIIGSSGHFGSLVSEEQAKIVSFGKLSPNAKYVVAIDPLDGSSNLGSNIPVGTIFSILRRKSIGAEASNDDFLQKGSDVVASGYAIYGSKTSFVYSAGQGVHGFTLDPAIGEFILTDENIKSPDRGSVYSVNEGRSVYWDSDITNFVADLKSKGDAKGSPYSARYAGSLVADFDRNMKNGGVFLYPADKKAPNGKLRLLYECIPLAFIAEQSGGLATDGVTPILQKLPKEIHERSPFYVGSKHEIQWLLNSRR